jgi:hypothetical protein
MDEDGMDKAEQQRIERILRIHNINKRCINVKQLFSAQSRRLFMGRYEIKEKSEAQIFRRPQET